ncbi:SGNH/GDSL hydrolase family protein [Burkholderia pseudomallei]|uniref:SGNH/GDSL hydrolase family protein n=1 Tax=Burkholderia pseudomallei TaxID=28450 RepID=UPI0013E904CA|nr:SGNH/GDSL hydrolase family protein [Burkholderia pseudomallei]
MIEAYGDSTQYGVTFSQSAGWTQNPYNAPYYLNTSLQAQFGAAVTVSNQGVSSTSAAMLLYGTDGAHLPWAQQMAQSRAQIVTINHAINDSGLGHETPADYKFALEQLIGIARAAGRAVVLEEPAPVCHDAAKAALLDQYILIMESVAQSLNVPIVLNYAYIKTLPNWRTMEPDCIHPDADLYKIIADRESRVVAPIVAAMLK